MLSRFFVPFLLSSVSSRAIHPRRGVQVGVVDCPAIAPGIPCFHVHPIDGVLYGHCR